MPTFFKGADVWGKIVEVHVVAEDGADGFSLGEVFRKAKGLSDATRCILDAVGELATEARARAEEGCHLVDVLGPGDHGNTTNACIEEGVQRVQDEGLIVDGEEALIRDICQRLKSGPRSAADENTAHT